MSIFPFGNKVRNERRSITKQNPICWKEVIYIYKKDRGWENVKHGWINDRGYAPDNAGTSFRCTFIRSSGTLEKTPRAAC